MRRLVYEVYIGQRFLAGPLSQNVKSVEVLNILRHDRTEVSVICRVEFKDLSSRSRNLFDDNKAEIHLLEKEKKGVYTFFVKRKLPNPPKGINPRSVYLSVPWRVENGTGTATLLGNAEQIRGMLKGLQKGGISYKVISLTDAKFSSSSLVSLLTSKQRKALTTAFNLGYYDLPRRIGSDELSRKLGISNPTFVAHRRKAERQLLAEILKAG
jgi:hypothetical protein